MILALTLFFSGLAPEMQVVSRKTCIEHYGLQQGKAAFEDTVHSPSILIHSSTSLAAYVLSVPSATPGSAPTDSQHAPQRIEYTRASCQQCAIRMPCLCISLECFRAYVHEMHVMHPPANSKTAGITLFQPHPEWSGNKAGNGRRNRAGRRGCPSSAVSPPDAR